MTSEASKEKKGKGIFFFSLAWSYDTFSYLPSSMLTTMMR